MQLMTLAALPDTELVLEVDGEDAAAALPVLTEALGAPSADGLDRLIQQFQVQARVKLNTLNLTPDT